MRERFLKKIRLLDMHFNKENVKYSSQNFLRLPLEEKVSPLGDG